MSSSYSLRRLLSVVVLVAAVMPMALIAPGQETAKKPAVKTVTATPTESAGMETKHELSAADVDVFMDGLLPALLQNNDVAGAVVMIVKDGKVFYSRGFGYADVKTKKPVSVDDTLFRPGSVSKLFTCTAVMQLVEQGKLDLDRDVNDYLDFKIPATYSQPVTLRRIMTHTAGFEEWGKDLFVPNAADLEPIETGLKEHLPKRIFFPGEMPAYSNFAMAVAGYIVQRISGEKFEDYIKNHIYKPLGMTHSSFLQPLPADLAPLMSTGYGAGSNGARGFEYVNAPPAGSMSVSAGDIAKFMIAHLQDGRYGDVQILRPETAKQMHSRTYGPVPELNGMDLAFFQENENGHTIIGHGGDTRWFHSHLSLILDSNLGFFISLNSAGRGTINIRKLVWDKFLDRYFPAAPPLPPAVASASEDAKTVAGYYITSRRGETTIGKQGAILSEAEFEPQGDGTIMASQVTGLNGQPKRWREIGPLLYRDTASQDMIAFVRQPSGLFYIYSSGAAAGFQEVPFTQSTPFYTWLRYFTIGVFVLVLVLWPAAALVRRHYGQPLDRTGLGLSLYTRVRVVCMIDAAVLLAWYYYFNALGPASTNRSWDWALHSLHVSGWIGAIGTVLVVANAIASWMSPARWKLSRLGDTLMALGCIGFVWSAILSNFLRFGTKF
jgi:CubicO group peptidase (beta-lactamase class C family)